MTGAAPHKGKPPESKEEHLRTEQGIERERRALMLPSGSLVTWLRSFHPDARLSHEEMLGVADRIEELEEFVRFIVTLDDPRAIELRRSITLTEIIERARTLTASEASPREPLGGPLCPDCGFTHPEGKHDPDPAAQQKEERDGD